MPPLTLWFCWKGATPTTWFEERFRNGKPTGIMERVTTPALPSSDETAASRVFLIKLAKMVQQMFVETINDATGKSKVFINFAGPDNKHQILTTDLLVYACRSRDRDSVLKKLDVDLFNELIQKHGNNVAGTTSKLASGKVISEAYLDSTNDGLTPMADAIYHEWMHNKTRYAMGENPEWVHKLDGLAAAKGGGGLTPRVKAAMKQRLLIANHQAVESVG